MVLENAMIEYAAAYEMEKAASRAFAEAFGKSVDTEVAEEEKRMKAGGRMSEYGTLLEDKHKPILREIKQEAWEECRALWEARKAARKRLGAAKRVILVTAKRIRKEAI